MTYCSYYQARVCKEKTWFLVAILRSDEHLAFDRTLNKEQAIFEFFVPEDREEEFVALLMLFKSRGIIYEFEQLENRLKDPMATL